VEKRFEWVSRVDAWTNTPLAYGSFSLSNKGLVSDGSTSMDLSKVHTVHFTWWSEPDTTNAFEKRKSEVCLAAEGTQMRFRGTLSLADPGNTFPTAIALLMQTLASRQPDLVVRYADFGRLRSLSMAILSIGAGITIAGAFLSSIGNGGMSVWNASLQIVGSVFLVAVGVFAISAGRRKGPDPETVTEWCKLVADYAEGRVPLASLPRTVMIQLEKDQTRSDR
jgi:hypothetical protein